MTTQPSPAPLPWLEPGQAFPPVDQAWGEADPAPGLVAAGGALDVNTLVTAYRHGIFPWYSVDQPLLWWCPNPRTVLRTEQFILHRSLRKTLSKLLLSQRFELRIDHGFSEVIDNCSRKQRKGQTGTWIVPEMVQAYIELHRAGHAHSVESWIDGQLVGGLYCVNVGGMVFGESMFSHQTDASKLALAGLVAFCRFNAIPLIDCQQDTQHLASLGGSAMTREAFCQHVEHAAHRTAPRWQFENVYWSHLLSDHGPST